MLTPTELQTPVTEVEIADAITMINGMMLLVQDGNYPVIQAIRETRNTVRRMAFELNQLRSTCNAAGGTVGESSESPVSRNPEE